MPPNGFDDKLEFSLFLRAWPILFLSLRMVISHVDPPLWGSHYVSINNITKRNRHCEPK